MKEGIQVGPCFVQFKSRCKKDTKREPPKFPTATGSLPISDQSEPATVKLSDSQSSRKSSSTLMGSAECDPTFHVTPGSMSCKVEPAAARPQHLAAKTISFRLDCVLGKREMPKWFSPTQAVHGYIFMTVHDQLTTLTTWQSLLACPKYEPHT